MKILSTSDFPGCCGISVISGFVDILAPTTWSSEASRKEYKNGIIYDLEIGIKEKLGSSQGLWMIVLASYQVKPWEDELLKRGWSKVVSGAMSNMHGNKLYVYVKLLHPETSDPDVLGDR